MSSSATSGGNGISIPYHAKPPGQPAFYDVWKLLRYIKDTIPYEVGVSFEPDEVEGQPVIFITCLWKIGDKGHYFSKPVMCGPKAGLTRDMQTLAINLFMTEANLEIVKTCQAAGVTDTDPLEKPQPVESKVDFGIPTA